MCHDFVACPYWRWVCAELAAVVGNRDDMRCSHLSVGVKPTKTGYASEPTLLKTCYERVSLAIFRHVFILEAALSVSVFGLWFSGEEIARSRQF